METADVEAVHTPVLLEETLRALAPRAGGETMIDATLGEGGHSYAFLSRFSTLNIIGIDADQEMLARARERLARFKDRISYYSGWSEDFFAEGTASYDTILIDLGISLYHYEKSARGFSFLKDEFLDMRIDTSRGRTAAELIASLSEKELADIIYRYGDERRSRAIARAVAAERRNAPIRSSAVLADIVRRAAGGKYSRLHPATRTFQALRIYVNRELEQLPALLKSALAALGKGGRLGVISFHSGEDREVKHAFKDALNADTEKGRLRLLTKKPVSAGEEERRGNPPSRSAKLRVIERSCDFGDFGASA
ncbi:MAG: 16S rRNA (cytosine(1402)-N(4))-methyltransferase RsmH [Treponema sp.]|jgi:16S rRNA (cytosine1402-N4)-methyltransferase|nr:16S rRNA (cytosine(1402)-N(4))-methyltransferase RsmH [Treponema sp.]